MKTKQQKYYNRFGYELDINDTATKTSEKYIMCLYCKNLIPVLNESKICITCLKENKNNTTEFI